MLKGGSMADSSIASVPDLSGLTQSAAEAKLRSVGLSIGAVTRSSSNTLPLGSVSKTKPTAGASIDVGSVVDLEISSGPADEQVKVKIVAASTETTVSSAANIVP